MNKSFRARRFVYVAIAIHIGAFALAALGSESSRFVNKRDREVTAASAPASHSLQRISKSESGQILQRIPPGTERLLSLESWPAGE